MPTNEKRIMLLITDYYFKKMEAYKLKEGNTYSMIMRQALREFFDKIEEKK